MTFMIIVVYFLVIFILEFPVCYVLRIWLLKI